MPTPLGWAHIQGNSVLGTDDGFLIKDGSISRTISNMAWDNTTQKLTITGTEASSEALRINTGSTTLCKTDVCGVLTTTDRVVMQSDIELGSENGRYALSVLASNNPFATSGALKLHSGNHVPAGHIGELLGPYSITVGSQLSISVGSVCAISDANTVLPSYLQPYTAAVT